MKYKNVSVFVGYSPPPQMHHKYNKITFHYRTESWHNFYDAVDSFSWYFMLMAGNEILLRGHDKWCCSSTSQFILIIWMRGSCIIQSIWWWYKARWQCGLQERGRGGVLGQGERQTVTERLSEDKDVANGILTWENYVIYFGKYYLCFSNGIKSKYICGWRDLASLYMDHWKLKCWFSKQSGKYGNITHRPELKTQDMLSVKGEGSEKKGSLYLKY